MTKDEALKLALEQLEFFDRSSHQHGYVWQKHLITAIKEALAQPEFLSSNEADIAQLIEERDVREDILDKVLDMVLGIDRPEWSSSYQYIDAVEDVREALAQPITQAVPQIPQEHSSSEHTGCACRWDDEGDRTVTCARHEGWLEVIAEWADRARESEKKLKALAQEQEPVAWFDPVMKDVCRVVNGVDKTSRFTAPLYTSPPQRQPLTEEQLDVLALDDDGLPNSHLEFARAIEAKHGIGDKT